jgi:rhodanese-related sulfurtransferase
MPAIPELRPVEFAERWPDHAQGDAVVLLDVREHPELALAAVEGALHIPMREVPGRLQEIARDKPVVVLCHSGRRSYVVADYLLGQGFQNVFNLRGGIDAWSTELDSRVPRY